MIKHVKISIPTYEVGKPEELPMFFERRNYQGASGKVYPLPFSSAISDQKTDKEYDAYIIENKYIKATLLPEIGGKIHSILDKTNNYDIIYNNKVIKPAMVGLCGPWVSGGIEFNWPQHHRPTTFMPVENEEKGETVYMGEFDNFFSMHGTVGISIKEDRSYVKAHIIVYNSTPYRRRFMWWANTAVEINKDYAVVFPPDVSSVNDHDRRCVLSWPIAKGVYKTVRPWNYGEGTDVHFTKNIVAATSMMVSKGESDFDFVCGYDHGKDAGVAMIADHRIAPGKKLWIWGNSPFASKWCENLTDDGSEYCELMTGCYTDNQPDFTMIEPYEKKEFDQYWYPIKKIGEPKAATLDAALNFYKQENKLHFGICPSGNFPNSTVIITSSQKEVFRKKVELSIENPYLDAFDFTGDVSSICIRVLDQNGNVLVEYKNNLKKHTPIKPREISPRPKDIKTNEELYLHGYHLYQYNHFSYKATDYFLEALRRDPTDMRSNEAMGDICLDNARFDLAKEYYSKAIEKAELRGPNPKDTSSFYGRGLANRYLGLDDEAESDFYNAVWQYGTRSSAYYALAGLASKRADKQEAIRLLNLSLETNAKNPLAVLMLGLLSNEAGAKEKVNEIDPLFFHENDGKRDLILVRELLQFGMLKEAYDVLSKTEKNPLVYYYLAYIHTLMKDGEEKKYIDLAEKADPYLCFPNDNFDVIVLENAGTPMANYYLGCLYYHRDQYEKAASYFEKTNEKITYYPSLRNLALAYFDHLGKKEEAYTLLKKAFSLSSNGRILYELVMMEVTLNIPLKDRVSFIEKNMELAKTRDDVLTKYVSYLVDLKEYDKAIEILKTHSFHTYEGGEGNLTSLHSNLYFLLGNEEYKKGNYRKAREYFLIGLDYPLNYHETITVHADNSHLYYGLALVSEKLGEKEEMENYLKKGISSLGGPNINYYFASKCDEKLGLTEKAKEKLDALYEAALDLEKNKDLDSYFGVGAPTRLPFAYDIPRVNTIKALELEIFALLGEGKKEEAKAKMEELKKLDLSSIALTLTASL
mgnify:FL=1